MEGSARAMCLGHLPPGRAKPAGLLLRGHTPTNASCGSQVLTQQGPVCSGARLAGIISRRGGQG